MAGGNITRIVGGTHLIETEEWLVYTDKFLAYAGEGSHFTADGGTTFGEPKDGPEVVNGAFVPIVSIGESENDQYKVFKEEGQSWTLDRAIDAGKRNLDSMVIAFKSKNVNRIAFKVEQGNGKANDKDGGIIKAIYFKKDETKTTIHPAKGYNTTIYLDISKEQGYDYILFYAYDYDHIPFYATDYDYNVYSASESEVYCGMVSLFKCSCNRDFTESELQNIVIRLRRKDLYLAAYYKSKSNLNRVFYNNTEEKIKVSMQSFTSAINKAFKEYEINTCIRKIHFLAQAYQETQWFSATHEEKPSSSVKGGPFYRGRGLIQVSHIYTYGGFYDYLISNYKFSECLDYNHFGLKGYKLNLNERNWVSELKKLKKNDPEKLEKFNKLVSSVATDIDLACLASGWFWTIFKKIEYGEKENQIKYREVLNKNLAYASDYEDQYLNLISKQVNGGDSGIERRRYAYKELKKIFNYNESCISKL